MSRRKRSGHLVLKPKIWGSSATLHFWERPKKMPNDAANSALAYDLSPNGSGFDEEQVCHGRWRAPADNFTWFNPSILGASPFERRAFAIKNRNR